MKVLLLTVLLLGGMHSLMAQWTMNSAQNTPVCTAADKQVDPRIMEDGQGGAFIVWKDYRMGASNPDIYVQRLDSLGIPKWTLNGVGVCTDQADQSTPAIISDMKGGAIIAWSDWRSGIERDLYAQRIDGNGNVLWTVNGANISNLSNREHSEKLASDGKGGVIIAFEKQIGGVWDVWAQRLDSSGNKVWGQGGIALSSGNSTRRNHRIQKDRRGGAIISWQDSRNGVDYDVYAQRLDAAGNLLWGPIGKPVCASTGDQINAKIDPDSATNGAFIAWQDTRNSPDYDIYMQRIDSMGNPLWTVNGVAVCNANGNQSALDLMSIDAGSEVIITWKDGRNGNNDIYVQKMDSNGSALWTANGMPVCNAAGDQQNPNICTDGNKGAVVVWQDESGNGFDIRAQRISNAGSILWTPNGVWVSTAADEQGSPKNCTDGKGGAIFAWQDKRSGTNDIYAHHLFGSGSPNTVVESALSGKVIVYPNPAGDQVWVKMPEGQDIQQAFLYSPDGRRWPLTMKPGENAFPLAHLTPGTYFLKLQTQEGALTVPLSKGE